MAAEMSFRNARIVLAGEIIEGSLNVVSGQIAAVEAGGGLVGEDFDGDFLIPGLVELHTDHLEGHFTPRPASPPCLTACASAPTVVKGSVPARCVISPTP